MDAIIKKFQRETADSKVKRPSQEEAEAAVRVLLAWAGDDPAREGLLDTPRRVTKAFNEYFSGYHEDPAETLSRTFTEVGGYDDIVMLRDIEFTSHCEHHIAPFVGRAHVAYLAYRTGRGHFQAGPRRRNFCPPPANPGNHDRPDRQFHLRQPQAPRVQPS